MILYSRVNCVRTIGPSSMHAHEGFGSLLLQCCTILNLCVALAEVVDPRKGPPRKPPNVVIQNYVLRTTDLGKPNFSTLKRYLDHQMILLEEGVDEDGDPAPELCDAIFPGSEPLRRMSKRLSILKKAYRSPI